jgi:hypothetical protein
MYKYVSFGTTHAGGVAIPAYKPISDISTRTARSTVIKTPGGAYQSLVTGQIAIAEPQTISLDCAIKSTTATLVETDFIAWRNLQGTVNQLWRVKQDGATYQFANAELVSVNAKRAPKHTLFLDVTLVFVLPIPIWNSEDMRTQNFTLDGGGGITVCAVDNDGLLPTRPTLSIHAHTANITALTIAATNTDLDWTGTLVVSKNLVLDCSRQSIKNDSVNCYSGLVRAAGHYLDGWLDLAAAGNTNVTITLTGGGADSIAKFETWEQFT